MKKDKHDMRVLLGRMRTNDGKFGTLIETKKKKELTTRELLEKTRKLNEDFAQETQANRKNKATELDNDYWIERFNNFFDDLDITLKPDKVSKLEITDDYAFWGAEILGQIQFLFAVTGEDNTSGAEFKYAEGFNGENEENKKIVERLTQFYNQFSDYCRKNYLV